MLTNQEIIEYKDLVRKISAVELSIEEARGQANKILQMYLAIYSKNLLGGDTLLKQKITRFNE